MRCAAESPAWLTALRADPAAEAAGVRWLPVPPEHPGPSGDRQAVQRVAEVALGGGEPCGQLLLTAALPDELVAALAPEQPQPLWIPVGSDLAALAQALAPYRAVRTPARLQLPLARRGFIGHTESLGRSFIELAAELARHPALAAGSWGSAYADDPWPRPLPADVPPAVCDLLQQRYARQTPGRPRSLTFVTRWSRSLVSLEDHDGALVLAIAYAAPVPPVPGSALQSTTLPHAAARSALSALLAAAPADVRWAVSELPWTDALALQERLRDPASHGALDGSDRVTALLGLAAVWDGDLRLLEVLRWLARAEGSDWALRAAGIAVAERHGYELLLHELCAGETDPELHAELVALTASTDPLPESTE